MTLGGDEPRDVVWAPGERRLALAAGPPRNPHRSRLWLVTARLARAGVTIGAGSDIWQIPTGAHLELQELVAAGLSPLEAIHAATGAAARVVGVEGDLGTIEVGNLADLVILDGDPRSDIRNTRRIRAVMQSGRWVERAGILARSKK